MVRIIVLVCVVFSMIFSMGVSHNISLTHSENERLIALSNLQAKSFVPLRQLHSKTLSGELKLELEKNAQWKKLINSNKMAVGLVIFPMGLGSPQAVWINGNVMMYAASLPKIAVLFATYQAIENGDLEETPEITELANEMIRYSNNEATNTLINKIGGLKNVQKYIKNPEYGFYDPKYGGGLWIGKYFNKDTKRYPEPMKGYTHSATVAQVCRFYYLIAQGKLINADRSAQMLDILSNPGLHHKFVNYLEKKYFVGNIFRKSGTWKIWHADSVMVWDKNNQPLFIAVGLVESPNGEAILRDLIVVMEAFINRNRVPNGYFVLNGR